MRSPGCVAPRSALFASFTFLLLFHVLLLFFFFLLFVYTGLLLLFRDFLLLLYAYQRSPLSTRREYAYNSPGHEDTPARGTNVYVPITDSVPARKVGTDLVRGPSELSVNLIFENEFRSRCLSP